MAPARTRRSLTSRPSWRWSSSRRCSSPSAGKSHETTTKQLSWLASASWWVFCRCFTLAWLHLHGSGRPWVASPGAQQDAWPARPPPRPRRSTTAQQLTERALRFSGARPDVQTRTEPSCSRLDSASQRFDERLEVPGGGRVEPRVCACSLQMGERRPSRGRMRRVQTLLASNRPRGANEVTQLTLGWSDNPVRTVVSDRRTPNFTKLRESRHQALEMRGRAGRGRGPRDPTPTPTQSCRSVALRRPRIVPSARRPSWPLQMGKKHQPSWGRTYSGPSVHGSVGAGAGGCSTSVTGAGTFFKNAKNASLNAWLQSNCTV